MKWVGGWKSSRASSSSLGQPLPMIDWHWFDPCLLNCLFGASRWSWSAFLAAGGFVHGGRGRIILDKLPAFLCLVWHAHHFEHGQDLMRTHFLHGIRQKFFPALSWKIAATARRTIIVVLLAGVGTAQRVQRKAASNLVANAGTAAQRGRSVVAAASILRRGITHVR